MAPSIQLDYKEGRPAWCLRLVQPQRFQNVEYSLQARLFLMPKGALIGILLKFYDEPAQPYFIHRVMDLTDPAVIRHVKACAEAKEIVAALETVGEQPGFDRTLKLDAAQWGACLRDGEAYNRSIPSDGEKALDQFLEVFRPISETKGVDAAWDEVDRRYPPPPAKRKGAGPWGLFGILALAALSYGVVADDLHALTTPGPHCHRYFCWRTPAVVKEVGFGGVKYAYCGRHEPLTGALGGVATVADGTAHLLAYLLAFSAPPIVREQLKARKA
jgi:hypothetical protein